MDNTPQSQLPWSTIEDRELNRLRECEYLLRVLMQDMESAVVAHDESDPRHRSHGGQHTNGRCCPFGNVGPAAVNVFKRWIREYEGFCK